VISLFWATYGQAAEVAEKVLDSYKIGDNLYVRALNVERATGTLWVGTSGGVIEVDLKTGAPRNTFTRQHGLANEYVFAIGIDRDGYKWFGTNAGGVSRYKDGKWKTYFPMHGLADYWIYSFASQKDGTLWIGTWAGVNKVDLKTMKFSTYVKELVNEWVYGIDVDSRNRVWFGTEGGISMFDGKTWKSWTHKDGMGAPNVEELPSSTNTGLGTRSRHDVTTTMQGSPTYNPNYVFSIMVDAKEMVWAGTWGGGVARFDGAKFVNFNTKNGLAGNIVYSMVQDRNGVYWFGTNKGVSRYDGKTFRNYGKNEGLLDDNVYALAVGTNDDVWVGSKRGVVRIGRK
jgi:ligand-binding sensor domain-containing protein